jgi:hypothetical protein
LCCFVVTGNDFKANFKDLPSTEAENEKRGFLKSISTTLRGTLKPKSLVLTMNITQNGYLIFMPLISYSKWTDGSLFLKGKVIEVTLTGIDDS